MAFNGYKPSKRIIQTLCFSLKPNSTSEPFSPTLLVQPSPPPSVSLSHLTRIELILEAKLLVINTLVVSQCLHGLIHVLQGVCIAAGGEEDVLIQGDEKKQERKNSFPG